MNEGRKRFCKAIAEAVGLDEIAVSETRMKRFSDARQLVHDVRELLKFNPVMLVGDEALPQGTLLLHVTDGGDWMVLHPADLSVLQTALGG